MLHAEVGEDGGLILGNGGVVELLDLGELVGVDEKEGGGADEFTGLITYGGVRRARLFRWLYACKVSIPRRSLTDSEQ